MLYSYSNVDKSHTNNLTYEKTNGKERSYHLQINFKNATKINVYCTTKYCCMLLTDNSFKRKNEKSTIPIPIFSYLTPKTFDGSIQRTKLKLWCDY